MASRINIIIVVVLVLAVFMALNFVIFHRVEDSKESNEDSETVTRIVEKYIYKTVYFNETKTMEEDETRTRWLTVVIPTISRGENIDYLTPTLNKLIEQLPSNPMSPYFKDVGILVINHNKDGKPHKIVEKNELRTHEDSKFANYVTFLSSNQKSKPCKPKFLCQKRDTMWTFNFLGEYVKDRNDGFVLILEDDWELCPNGFVAMRYAMEKALEEHPNFISLRVSFGLNGIVMKNADVPGLFPYFKAYRNQNKPPDHIIYDYWKDSKRRIVSFRHNLFFHIGAKSTVQKTEIDTGRAIPKCYVIMYDWLLELERYHNEDCPWDDIYPCPKMTPNRILPDFDSNAQRMCRRHFPICKDKSIKTVEQARKNFCRIKYDDND